jgi:hypothetical protein
MTHVLVIREADSLSLRFGQSRERTLYVRVHFFMGYVFVDVGPRAGEAILLLGEAFLASVMRFAPPEAVNRTTPRESDDPGKRSALQRIVTGCPLPYLQKYILEQVLCVTLAAECFHAQAFQEYAVAIMQQLQAAVTARLDHGHHLLVGET